MQGDRMRGAKWPEKLVYSNELFYRYMTYMYIVHCKYIDKYLHQCLDDSSFQVSCEGGNPLVRPHKRDQALLHIAPHPKPSKFIKLSFKRNFLPSSPFLIVSCRNSLLWLWLLSFVPMLLWLWSLSFVVCRCGCDCCVYLHVVVVVIVVCAYVDVVTGYDCC